VAYTYGYSVLSHLLTGVTVVSIFKPSAESIGLPKTLQTSLNRLNSSLTRLSSGTRINQAADDAAGLAVISSLDMKLRATERATRNIGDASSALSLADGAISQIQTLSGRLQELAVQSANGVYSDQERTGLRAEFNSLTETIRRISDSTEFNGVKLFDGSSISVQIGSDGSSGSTLAVGGIDLSHETNQLAALDISSQSGAKAAIDTIQSFSQRVSLHRSTTIGAAQNRLSSLEFGLSAQHTALSTARTQIADVDIAEESANLARYSILAQAGISVMAQTNKLNSAVVEKLLGVSN
jgi:flagellin